jgi:hypothetical protein
MYVFSPDSLSDREDRESSYPAPYFGTWSARAKLLYGQWTTADGTVVLFDRKYRPRWRRKPDGIVEPADPAQWIEGIVGETWLYTDRTPLPDRRAIARKVLQSWGVGA